MKAVQIVTVKNKKPLFKGSEEAHSIELISFEENGFEVVTQKNLYDVGEKAVYIQPDYCLSDISLFKTFIESGKLGGNNRIKAIKFNFNTEPNNTAKTYSVGILLPIKEVLNFICISDNFIGFSPSMIQLYTYANEDAYDFTIIPKQLLEVDLDNELGITKYEEPERNSGGLKSGLTKATHLPEGMYKTDETNIKNLVGHIEYPIELIGTLKIDGSSCTIYYKDENNFGICSRNQEKKLDQKQIVGYEGFKRHYNKDTNERGWVSDKTEIFYNEESLKEIGKDYSAANYTGDEEYYENLPIPIWDELYDDFIQLGKPILDKLVEYCKENNKSLALRGEIAGKNLKGSGNKNNPHSKLEPAFYLYGVDDYSTGVTVPVDFQTYVITGLHLNLYQCPVIFKKVFNSFEEIKTECENYFKNNLVEGIVLRTPDNKFSCKFMNDAYDNLK
jgi:hypothetical protein